MGLFDVFRKTPAPLETKESLAAATLVMSPGQAIWSPRDYKQFAVEAYGRNVVAYQCISRIAEAVASVEYDIFRGETEMVDHDILHLIDQPNPMQSKQEYMEAKIGFLMIAGNGYEERFVQNNQIKELYQLRPDRMKIIPGKNGMPSAYKYSTNTKTATWDVDPQTLNSDCRHMKFFHPYDDWYGMSPVEPTAYSIDQLNESMQWLQSLLQNSARPSGALVTGKENTLSADAFQRLKSQIDEQYVGSTNAGRPMLLEGGLDWKAMSLSPSDMGIIEAKATAARDVALGFGVPPQLLGIPGDNTYANYKEARLAFWEDTIIPLVVRVSDDWSAWFGQVYDGVEVVPNFEKVPAIIDKRNTLWNMADKATDLTINERREMKGYEPIAGGDVLFVPSSSLPIDVAGSFADMTPEDAKALKWGFENG